MGGGAGRWDTCPTYPGLSPTSPCLFLPPHHAWPSRGPTSCGFLQPHAWPWPFLGPSSAVPSNLLPCGLLCLQPVYLLSYLASPAVASPASLLFPVENAAWLAGSGSQWRGVAVAWLAHSVASGSVASARGWHHQWPHLQPVMPGSSCPPGLISSLRGCRGVWPRFVAGPIFVPLCIIISLPKTLPSSSCLNACQALSHLQRRGGTWKEEEKKKGRGREGEERGGGGGEEEERRRRTEEKKAAIPSYISYLLCFLCFGTPSPCTPCLLCCPGLLQHLPLWPVCSCVVGLGGVILFSGAFPAFLPDW